MKYIMRSVSLFALIILASQLSGCGGDGSGDPMISGATGSTVSLAWDPVQDPTVYAYYVHYGTQPTNQPGSCSYSNVVYVTSPAATIVGLDPNTEYYFAVSAYNGLSGPCSNEVSTVTPASQA